MDTMSNEPEQARRSRPSSWLTGVRSRIVAGGLAVILLAGGTGALLAKSQTAVRKPSSRAAAVIATATATPPATPLPTATATPMLRPTTTRKAVNAPPSGPPNYLVVRIGGCSGHWYPSLYFTSTDPGKFDELYWYQIAPYPPDYLFGNEGAYIGVNHTEEVVVLPDDGSEGPLTFTVQADRTLGNVDYGPAGYWHGTVYPCG
ncbi:MAG TPA: hypothetical protein VKT52_05850 [Ktedonobacterales bacterium]|nr:hypothetical protein [Ktedonobacterales bacterium]